MTIRLKNQLNRLYKHKPKLVAPIINTVVHEAKDGDVVEAIPTKVVVARIMKDVVANPSSNNTDSNHNPSSNNSWRGGRGREGRGGMYNKSNV